MLNLALSSAICILQLAPLVVSLRMTEFSVPEFAHLGKRVILKCQHRLNYNDGVLDSVRWYKVMGREMVNFYTYKPGGLERDRKQTKHRLQGINVLMSKSNAEQVVLKKVQINSSGHYKCEVTTKKDNHYGVGPPFDAVSAVGRLQVVALPNQPPEISGGGSNYAYGDELDLNCTGKPTYPPTKLTWFINDIEARDPFIEESLSKTDNNLYYSETRLTIKVSSTQFQAGEMRIRCVASLIEEPIKADPSSNRDGIVLEVIKLPEAMKLQTENIFDVPVTGGGESQGPPAGLTMLFVLVLLQCSNVLITARI